MKQNISPSLISLNKLKLVEIYKLLLRAQIKLNTSSGTSNINNHFLISNANKYTKKFL